MRDTRHEILAFWFEETAPAQWFQKNPDFDEQIRVRFMPAYEMARDGLFSSWANDADGALALCILLDQFPRNMFRDTPAAFATDAAALAVARAAIAAGFDQVLPPLRRRFLYLPFEHSEVLADQRESVTLFESMINDDPLGHEYALRHLAVIEKFGRFPHRNIILGRTNTAAEQEYLASPGAGF